MSTETDVRREIAAPFPSLHSAPAIPEARIIKVGDFDLNALTRLQLRIKARSYGSLRLNPVVSEVTGLVKLAVSALPGIPTQRKLSLRAAAARHVSHPVSRRILRQSVRDSLVGTNSDAWRRYRIGWDRYLGDGSAAKHIPGLSTSVLLKAPGPDGEKGVLYSAFESNWIRLLSSSDARRFLEKYYLVGASSWSPPDYAVFGAFAGLGEDPLFVGISNDVDLVHYRDFSPVVRPVNLLASDLIDPRMYSPRPRDQRDIDITVVSHWHRFKRHWILFEALAHLPPDLRVVLVGRDADGRTMESLAREAAAFGVRQELEIHYDLTIEEVNALYCRSKVSGIFSAREGSCVTVSESLFADTPVVVMKGAHIGARRYINEHTGRVVTRRDLAREIAAILAAPERFSPRKWAMDNIAASISSRRLNAELKEHAVATGRPWTRDIVPLCRRYVPQYLERADEERMMSAKMELESDYGVRLLPFVHRRFRSS